MSKERFHYEGSYDSNREKQKLMNKGYQFFQDENGIYKLEDTMSRHGYKWTFLKIQDGHTEKSLTGNDVPIYTCEVSYANLKGGVELLNAPYTIFDSRTVQVELDLATLQNIKDSDYIIALMTQLLDMNRVRKYVDNETVKIEDEDIACGNYVGYINRNYGKAVDSCIAKESAKHQQEQYDRRALEKNNEKIAYYEDEINKLRNANRRLEDRSGDGR